MEQENNDLRGAQDNLLRAATTLGFSYATDPDPVRHLHAATQALETAREYAGGSVRVGRVSAGREIDVILNQCVSLRTAIEDGDATTKFVKKVQADCIDRCQKLVQQLQAKARARARAEEDKDDEDALDDRRVVEAAEEFGQQREKFVARLAKKKLGPARPLAFLRAPIAVVAEPAIPRAKLARAGIEFTAVPPVLILHRQHVAAVHVAPGEDIDVDHVLRQARAELGARFLSPAHASMDSRAGLSSTLAVRGVRGVKIVWLLEHGVYSVLAPLKMRDLAFPW